MHVQVLRIKKLSGKGIILKAAKHNHREIQAEIGIEMDGVIDPLRIADNRILLGASSAIGVANSAQLLMDEAKIKPLRKDAVRALELIVSLPPNSAINHERFFNESLQWVVDYFKAPIISAIVHNDEAAPHCHVLILPLIAGRMVGSDLLGHKTKLVAMQADFHLRVSAGHGLKRQTQRKPLSAGIRKLALDIAFEVLQINSGLSDAVLSVLLEPHRRNPEPLLNVLHLKMPKLVSAQTFVEIMTQPCKPDKPIGFADKKLIGFDELGSITDQTLSCVGFQISDGLNSNNIQAISAYTH